MKKALLVLTGCVFGFSVCWVYKDSEIRQLSSKLPESKVEWNSPIGVWRTKETEVEHFDLIPYGTGIDGKVDVFGEVPTNPEDRWTMKLRNGVFLYVTKVDGKR